MSRPQFLVLGASGQLGQEWVDHLRADRQSFIAYGSEFDLTRHDDVLRRLTDLRPEIVLNCAAYTKVDQAETERDRAFKVNAEAAGNLAAACADLGLQLVHYSTDYVYPGLLSDRVKFPAGYPEDAETLASNVYAESKLEGDRRILANYPGALIIRVSWLCGQHGHNFVKTVIRLAKERGMMSIVNDQWGSPSFADNVVENTLVLLRHELSGLYHITSLGVTTWYEIARAVVQDLGLEAQVKPITTAEYPTTARRPEFTKLDTRKLENVEGAVLEPWRNGLQRLLMKLK